MKKIIALGLLAIFSAWFSYSLAHYTIDSDFPVYYNAAQAIIDGKCVYDMESLGSYSTPEPIRDGAFIYSLPVAYFMAPLAWLPYYSAKATIIFFSLTGYLLAVGILLTLNKTRDRWFMYPLMLSVLFLPFLQDLRAAQVNSVILFLIVISVYFAIRNLPCACGAILAIAALLKIFPIAIAIIFGLKNWRIAITCIIIFGLSFLVPGSIGWIPAIGNINQANYVPLFILIGPYGFMLFTIIIGGLTALLILRRREEMDYLYLASFSIPTIFLVMPLVEYYHLVLLIFPYIYLLTYFKLDVVVFVTVISSFVLISAAFFFSNASVYFYVNLMLSKTFVTLGLASLWGILALKGDRQTIPPFIR